MSEYQYYDFRAIDRALTKAEMAELRSVSTRAVITSTSFTNHYEWGPEGRSSQTAGKVLRHVSLRCELGNA